jgi:hypothetical protein
LASKHKALASYPAFHCPLPLKAISPYPKSRGLSGLEQNLGLFFKKQSKCNFDQNKEGSISSEVTTQQTTFKSTNDVPPIYYDSEPSSQPPKYSKDQDAAPHKLLKLTPPHPEPSHQHRSSVTASTVAAILASGYDDLDVQRRPDRKKKTLRQRWKDFKERNSKFDEHEDRGDAAGLASAAEWNMQGARLNGGMTTPYRKKGGK